MSLTAVTSGSLVLSEDVPPGRAQQITEQGVAQLVIALIDVVDHSQHEGVGRLRVGGPVVRFHHKTAAGQDWPSCIRHG